MKTFKQFLKEDITRSSFINNDLIKLVLTDVEQKKISNKIGIPTEAIDFHTLINYISERYFYHNQEKNISYTFKNKREIYNLDFVIEPITNKYNSFYIKLKK